jgi:hypothetical protein
MARASGLMTLRWKKDSSPHALYALRKAFADVGMRSQEQQVTYAIMHGERLEQGPIASALNYVLFEITSDWGAAPGRPLLIMLLLIPPFGLFYMPAFYRPTRYGRIYRIWQKERADRRTGNDSPERLTAKNCSVWRNAIYFSVLSAFFIGWRDLNIGSWINRLTPQEYTLVASGWVRTISGVQSLLSVYLLALAVLSYFGRPFE